MILTTYKEQVFNDNRDSINEPLELHQSSMKFFC